jgi:toxin FitB
MPYPACPHGWRGIPSICTYRSCRSWGISYGVAWLRHRQAQRKAALLQAWLDDVTAFHQSRILMVGDDVALRAGQLLAKARAGGVAVGAEDALIAATADLHAMTVLTANARHFAPMGVRYVDPRAGLPQDFGP